MRAELKAVFAPTPVEHRSAHSRTTTVYTHYTTSRHFSETMWVGEFYGRGVPTGTRLDKLLTSTR